MHAISILQSMSGSLSQVISIAPRAQKVYEFVTNNFYLLGNICLVGYGIKEAGIDRTWYASKEVQKAQAKSWCGLAFAKILQAQSHPREFYTLHGALLICSGAFGVGHSLLGIGLFSALCDGLFMLASAIAVKYYAEQYRSAKSDSEKTSAILGMLSSLGYVLCGALVAIGASASIALLIGCLAIATGCIKIFYDNCLT